jgi:putative transcriptional regulator
MIRILLSTRLGELRWTQADLARKTGIRPSTINELYHDIAERVSFEHLDLICEALECDLTDIVIRVPRGEVRIKSRNGTELHTDE